MQDRRNLLGLVNGCQLAAVAACALLGACGQRAAPARPHVSLTPRPAHVQILGFNDFHGQLAEGKRVGNRPAGGAVVLASYLRAEQASFHGDTVLIHAGDHVGASPPESALLQDEPSISFLNLLANPHCTGPVPSDPRCNVVGTLGNHELDEGVDEIKRLVFGGNHARGPFLEPSWQGARFPYVSANIVELATGKTLLRPYTIVQASGVRLGVIGAVLQVAPSVVAPAGVFGLRFLDEAQAINGCVRELKAQGVEAIVVTIHQGGEQASYEGPTRPDVTGPEGVIADIVRRLDDAVDVVISGHAHNFSNALLYTQSGHPVLVTQAFSAGRAYADIELTVDVATGEVLSKTARVVSTFADTAPDNVSTADVKALVQSAKDSISPLANRVIGKAARPISSDPSESGESALGDLIADAQRASTGAEIAFMNQGGIRADLAAGPITWGALFTIQPFGNTLVTMELSGAQLRALLEEQFTGGNGPLQISGLRYTFSASAADNAHVLEASVNGTALSSTRVYRVVTNNFLAGGRDGYRELARGTNVQGGMLDLDALIAYVERLGRPLAVAVDGRIKRVP